MSRATDQALKELIVEAAQQMVTVYIENSYACGRESSGLYVLPAPAENVAPDSEELEQWFDEYVHDLTGDGHPCGSREHAFYEATIVRATGHPDLVGESYDWEG